MPSARIVHFGGQSTGQIRTESFVNLWQSRHRFYRTHYGRLKFWLAQKIVQIGMKRKAQQLPELADACRQVQQIWMKRDV